MQKNKSKDTQPHAHFSPPLEHKHETIGSDSDTKETKNIGDKLHSPAKS